MEVIVRNEYQFVHEVRSRDRISGLPLASQDVTSQLGELVDEAFTNAALAERLPQTIDQLRVHIMPEFDTEPFVKAVRIELAMERAGADVFQQQYTSGPWARAARTRVLELREEGTLAEHETPALALVALKCGAVAVPLPPLQLPPMRKGILESCGVRSLGEGSLVPNRPVLINKRFVQDSIRQCEDADVRETGGAALGQVVRLDAPLPGTDTRIVTVLSGTVFDSRHVGDQSRFLFKPEALAEAQRICALRGLGERVMTVFHTHGWSKNCGNCNQNAACPLAEATPSLQDYQLLTTLFPGKSTLMPIAGRKLGDGGRRPVLQVYAWRRGQMRPIRWQEYHD